MKRRGPARRLPLLALLVAFCAGVLVDWSLHTYGPPQPADGPPEGGMRAETRSHERRADTSGSDSRGEPETGEKHAAAGTGSGDGAAIATTGTGALRVPIDDVKIESFKGGFAERRGNRPHEAVDILAPRNTPIRAVESGTIAKLFVSKQGGNTIYQFDPSGRLCYYYAHLERYATNLREGDRVSQGQVIGYVGTSGNAPANTPHLHFAVFELADDHRWWEGRALDPYLVFRGRSDDAHGH